MMDVSLTSTLLTLVAIIFFLLGIFSTNIFSHNYSNESMEINEFADGDEYITIYDFINEGIIDGGTKISVWENMRCGIKGRYFLWTGSAKTLPVKYGRARVDKVFGKMPSAHHDVDTVNILIFGEN